MRQRGQKYWAWSDCQLHSRCHAEELRNGAEFEVQVRLSRKGATEMFIGVYRQGASELEEYYSVVPEHSLTSAMLLGIDRAKALATGTAVAGQASLLGLKWSAS